MTRLTASTDRNHAAATTTADLQAQAMQAVTIGSGGFLLDSQFGLDGRSVNLAGTAVQFTGTDPNKTGILAVKDGSFNGLYLTTGTPPGGIVGQINAHGLVVNTGAIVASGSPEIAGHLTIKIAPNGYFVQQGSLDLFNGGSLRIDGHDGSIFVNDATLDPLGGTLNIEANLSGTGTIIDGTQVRGETASVELGRAVGVGETVDMGGSQGFLQLDRPLEFLGTITNFNGMDRIVLDANPVLSASFDSQDDLLLYHHGDAVQHLHFANPPPTLYVSDLAGGGVAITGDFGSQPPGSIAVHPHNAIG